MTADPSAAGGTPAQGAGNAARAGSGPDVAGRPSSVADPGKLGGAGDPPKTPNPAPAGQPGSPDVPAPPPSSSARAQAAASRSKKSDVFIAAEARAAEQHLDSAAFGGDFIAGDKNEIRYELRFGSPGSTFRAYSVTAEERASAFIEPAEFGELERSSEAQTIVVLTGPAGTGKSTVLLRLLAGGPSGADAVFRLDPTTELSKLVCDEVPEGAVLLLDDLPAAQLSSLNGYEIHRLTGQLGDRGCRLGLTTTAVGTSLSTTGGCVVLGLRSRPEPRVVFDHHMAQLMLGRRVEWQALRDRPDLQEFLAEELDISQHLGAAAELARRVAAVAHDPQTAVERLRQPDGDAIEECARWFRELGDAKANCFAVALAVLDGMPRETVARSAESLERLVAPQPDTVIQQQQAPNPFAVAAVVSPSRLRAEVVGKTRTTHLGEIREQVIRYLRRDFAGLVLRHVWREHDWIRPSLLIWFRYLGSHQDARVRVRAATAVGVIGRDSLETVVDEVVDYWARAADDDCRDSAAVALGPPLGDAALATTVRALVAQWGRAQFGEDASRLRAAAARTYGTVIGSRSPTAALRGLAELADDDEFDVVVAVARSYRELMLESTPALSLRVLDEVNRLAADRKQELRFAGVLTCLELASRRGLPDSAGDAIANPTWPTALLLAAQRPRTAPLLARLFALSLSDRVLGGLIGDELDDWAREAESDPDLRTALVALVADTAAVDQRSATTVYRRAQLWTARNGTAAITGQSVLSRFA